MTNEKLFEVATRTKMRFPFKGSISVEDLWDLKVEELDAIFKKINSELKQQQEESLLDVKTKKNKDLEDKIEIIKYIVGVKQKEAQSKEKAQELKQEEQALLALLKDKEKEALANKSPEEIREMLKNIQEQKDNQ